MDLQGKVAFVTGGGSGIGAAICSDLAAHGVAVVVADVAEDRAGEVAAGVIGAGGAALATFCDVTDADSVAAARDLALAELGRVDIVVNNAGVLSVGRPEDLPLDEWDRVVDVNLLGVVRGIHAFLPHLLAQGSGHIVTTASIAGLFPYSADMLPYTATKAAVLALSEGLALSVRPRGVGVSCLCPAGVFPTRIGESARHFSEDLVLTSPPLDRVAPADLAALVVDAIESDRFLVVTAAGALEYLERHGQDVDRYLDAVTVELGARAATP